MEGKLIPDDVLSLLCCPQCRASLIAEEEEVICVSCSRSYPVIADIIDFRRDDIDLTAGFFIEHDRQVAELLLESFSSKSYFDLYDIYCDAMKSAEGTPLTSDQKAVKKAYRQVLVNTHLMHGPSMLRKVSSYIGELGRERSWRGGVALEDGAGLGQYVEGFSHHFDTLLVVDLSLCYLLLARKLVDECDLDNVILFCGNVEKLPVAEGVIDFVHSNNMIEHVSDPYKMFKEAKRVLKTDGLFFMLSPNRFSLVTEPHFRLVAFGFIPKPLRRMLVRRLRGRDDLEDIQLRSLSEIKHLARNTFGSSFSVTFLPRLIGETTLQTPVRRLVRSMLKSQVTGYILHLLLNRIFLPVMPYHVALCFKEAESKSAGRMHSQVVMDDGKSNHVEENG